MQPNPKTDDLYQTMTLRQLCAQMRFWTKLDRQYADLLTTTEADHDHQAHVRSKIAEFDRQILAKKAKTERDGFELLKHARWAIDLVIADVEESSGDFEPDEDFYRLLRKVAEDVGDLI